MRPALLSWYLVASLGAQAAVLSYPACIAACAGTAAGWNSFCGATTAAAAAMFIPWWTPMCYSAGVIFGTPAGQKACQVACNLLLP